MSQLPSRTLIQYLLLVLICPATVFAQSDLVKDNGGLSPNHIISSTVLEYDLQYRVYTPPGYASLDELPVIYVTDGQWYISEGRMTDVLDEMIDGGLIEPVLAVFVDNRNPYNVAENRRNGQFWCNEKYARFFETELIPEVDGEFRTKADRSARVILGLSFGGLNAACFGLQAADSFEGIAMQSPAMRPVPTIFDQYESAPNVPLKIFLSTGTVRDNEAATRRLKSILETRGFELRYIEVPFGHDWSNWGPLLDDVLLFYYGRV